MNHHCWKTILSSAKPIRYRHSPCFQFGFKSKLFKVLSTIHNTSASNNPCFLSSIRILGQSETDWLKRDLFHRLWPKTCQVSHVSVASVQLSNYQQVPNSRSSGRTIPKCQLWVSRREIKLNHACFHINLRKTVNHCISLYSTVYRNSRSDDLFLEQSKTRKAPYACLCTFCRVFGHVWRQSTQR